MMSFDGGLDSIHRYEEGYKFIKGFLYSLFNTMAPWENLYLFALSLHITEEVFYIVMYFFLIK